MLFPNYINSKYPNMNFLFEQEKMTVNYITRIVRCSKQVTKLECCKSLFLCEALAS